MSLSAAISASVTALNAQSAALATVSTNLANSSTNGYKASTSSFNSLLAGSSGSSNSGGVTVTAKADLGLQGILTTSSVESNIAIDGNGMFAVTADADSNEVSYTRNGEFSVDAEGYLVNNGYYLQGWETNADGTVKNGTSASTLSAIDTDAIAALASATSTATMVATLPAEASLNSTFTSTMDVYDSLGTAAVTTMTWTKTAENVWSVEFSDPVLASDDTQTVGTVSSSSISVTFNEDGTLASTDPASPSLSITGWTTGAADSAVTLDMGDAGTTSGLSQYDSGEDTPSLSVKVEQDGVAYGTLSGVSVEDDGTVYASYSNGMQISVYKIAVATFSNADGLTALNGGVYAQSSASGAPTYTTSGNDGAGTIYGGQLESSTTDTNTEFSRMMAAQQAYSGAAQAMSTANTMFDTLMSAIR